MVKWIRAHGLRAHDLGAHGLGAHGNSPDDGSDWAGKSATIRRFRSRRDLSDAGLLLGSA